MNLMGGRKKKDSSSKLTRETLWMPYLTSSGKSELSIVYIFISIC